MKPREAPTREQGNMGVYSDFGDQNEDINVGGGGCNSQLQSRDMAYTSTWLSLSGCGTTKPPKFSAPGNPGDPACGTPQAAPWLRPQNI